MRRVVSLFLPHLSVERIRRSERAHAPRPEPRVLTLPVDDDPGPCSVPSGGGWRPGARWASRDDVERRIASLPTHAKPPMRELGRRSEAAQHPFKGSVVVIDPSVAGVGALGDAAGVPALHPLALYGRVAVYALEEGNREVLVNGNMRGDAYVIDRVPGRLLFRIDRHTARADRQTADAR